MKFNKHGLEWSLTTAAGETFLSCRDDKPVIYVGYGRENVDMYRGNFK